MRIFFLLVTLFLSLASLAEESQYIPNPDERLIPKVPTGPVGELEDVQCIGNNQFDCDHLKSFIYFDTGEIFSWEDLRRAETRILNNVGIESVRVTPETDAGRYFVNVEPVEKDSTEFFSGLTAQTVSDAPAFLFNIEFIEDNMTGLGDQFWVQAQVRQINEKDEKSLQSNFIQVRYKSGLFKNDRLFFTTDVRSYSIDRRNAKDPSDDDEFRLERFETSLGGALGYRFYPGTGFWARYWDASFGIRFIFNSDFERITSSDAGQQSVREKEFGSALVAAVESDTRDDRFLPTKGDWTQLYLEQQLGRSNESETIPTISIQREYFSKDGDLYLLRFGRNAHDPFKQADNLDVSVGLGDNFVTDLADKSRWTAEAGFNFNSLVEKEDFSFNPGIRFGARFLTDSLGVIDVGLMGIF